MPQVSDASSRRAETTSRTDRPTPARGFSAVSVGALGTRWEQSLMGVMAAYVAAVTVWLVSLHGHSVEFFGLEGTLRLLSPFPVAGVAIFFAWRASRELSLDLGSRKFWRLLLGVLALVMITPWLRFLPLLPMAWLDIGVRLGVTVSAPLLMLAALLQLPSAPHSSVDKSKLWLDIATVVVGGVLVAWYNLNTARVADDPIIQISFQLLHVLAVLDLVLVLVASILWRRTALIPRANILVLIGGALLVRFLGHVAAITEMHGGARVPDLMFVTRPTACFLMAAAGWLSSATVLRRDVRPTRDRDGRSVSILPYAAVVPGFALLLHLAFEDRHQPLLGLVIGAAALTVIAFARQFAASREAVSTLAEASARDSEARFRSLVQHSSDVIMIVDPDGTLRFASPSMSTVFGHEPSRLVGTNLVSMLHVEDQQNAVQFLDELARTGARTGAGSPGVLKREWRLAHADGSWMTVDNVGTNLLREPVVRGLVLNSRDVTEQSMIKQQYIHQAFHDPLTDLANRSLFLYQVGHALARGARQSSPVTVLFLDLDNFKTVNDSLGHAAGDRLLVDAARRLASCVRASDLIARLGGDEFAVLVEDAQTVEEVLVVASRIGTALSRPFMLSGKEVFVSSSIGIARSSRGESSDELVRNADVAMYVAKTRGKGQHVLFEQEMHDAALERLVVEADLRRAIERDEFFLEFQPIVELDTGNIIGAEALVRWLCRERGTVPPGVFIPIAEVTGLIVPIGKWVLRRACREAQRWTRERGIAARITVNLSGRQLQDAGIVDDVRQALEETGLDPTQLVLEITESMLMQNTDVSMARLTALKALGVSLAIDDFGTGYSSLSYLQRYPIDILKIDKAFVDVIDKGGEGPVLASAIVALGDTLRMNTVAEGIETEAQRGHLLTLGCELGQGYLFSPPLDEEEFWHLLLARGSRVPYVNRRLRDNGEQQAA
ncbi:MAG TPA: EAL domain-containing protein [Gemmatimonas sp.]